jgi:hypothetical protein
MFQTLVGKLSLAIAMFAVITFAASAAKADSVTLNLNVGSTLPNGNYGTITLTTNASGQILGVVSLLNGARVINTGQDCSICFNSTINPTITASSVTAGYALISGSAGSLHADGFGNFEYGLDYTGGNGGGCAGNVTPCQSIVNFTLTCTSCGAGGFSTVNQLIENSTGGGIASSWAVDIVCPACGPGVTGYVGTTGPTQTVPEPTSMLLLGTGLLGVGAGARRRLRRK